MAGLELGQNSLGLQNSVDIDILADLSSEDPSEFIPVDQFFGSYVHELSSRSKRAHEPDAGAAGKTAKLAADQTAGMGMLSPGLAMPPMLQQAGMQPQAGLAGGMQPPYMSMAFNGQLAMGGQQGGMLGMPGAMPQMQAMPAPGLNGSSMLPGMLSAAGGSCQMPLGMMGMPGGLPGGMPGGYGGPIGGGGAGMAGLDLGVPNVSATLSGDGGEASGGECGGKPRKTFKQQEANKVAQQRYRERKKQKFHEMEATIDQLSQQLQALQALQSRNQMLEGLNGDLHTQLVTREKEVERLKQALDLAAEKSLGSHPSSPSTDAADTPLECGDDGCINCDVLPHDMAGIDFKKGFSDQVERLHAFLQQHDLLHVPIAEAALSKEVLMELAQLVGRSCQLCQAALRAEGVRVMELISKDPRSLSTVGSEAEQQRWQACLDTMQLSPEQQEHLLLSRRSHLQQMRAIYEERHKLNMQAMALMLPHSSRNPDEDNTVEGRLASMSQAGYLPVAKSSAKLSDVLDLIKDNLRREQRAVMDLNCLLMVKILQPLQGARYMLGAYPQHCDALALSNTLAKSLGGEAVSDGTHPPANGAAQASSGSCHPRAGCC